MDYPKFMELPAEVKVQVIKKCYPIPYVRLRQSCRHLDEISEQYQKNLKIYCYRDQPHLYLTNSLSIEPFNNVKVEDIYDPHVVVAYGKYDGSHNFCVPMTSQNISKIRRSLSGFYFWEAILVNTADVEDDERNKKFDEALSYFVEIARDLNFRYVGVKNVTKEQIERVLGAWSPRGITFNDSGRVTNEQDLKQIVQMEAVKKMPWADIYINHYLTDVTSKLIEELARGKETLFLVINGLSPEVAVEAYNILSKQWAKENNYPELFYFYFYDGLSVFDQSTGYNILSFTHINNFISVDLSFKELLKNKRKYDIWLSKEKDFNRWQLVSLRRVLNGMQTDIHLCLRTGISTETLLQRLFVYSSVAHPGHALDYSSFYEKVKNAQTVEEIKQEYTKLTEEMLRFYKKTYRRSILNVACELVTEWWNWPRWILEFTKRRPIEKRPPIVDLGYVLFQEILCPIYQYSTMPYSL